jgi:MSHA biogenesis protein MshN
MSVINQLLADLEKRRASPAERSVLPSHVRALPDAERSSNWGWLAAGGAIVATALGVSWTMLSGFDRPRPSADAALPARALQKAVTAPAAVKVAVAPQSNGETSGRDAPASRFTFELSALPARMVESPATEGELVPIARGAATAGEKSAAGSEPRAAPSPTGQRVVVASPQSKAAAAQDKPEIRKQVHQPTAREIADSEYGKATTLLHQGRFAEAQEGFRSALTHHPVHHRARQALVGLLVESRSLSEAERVLQDGLALAPAQSGFAMTLARLQVDRGDDAQAIATLQKGVDHARANADYLAFLAALLQRQSRHEDAIVQYQSALRLKPATGVWWIGMGISLQAANRRTEAQEAFQRARATNSLGTELAAFAEQRLRQLQ